MFLVFLSLSRPTSQNLKFNKNLKTKIKKIAFFEYISSTKEIPEPFLGFQRKPDLLAPQNINRKHKSWKDITHHSYQSWKSWLGFSHFLSRMVGVKTLVRILNSFYFFGKNEMNLMVFTKDMKGCPLDSHP